MKRHKPPIITQPCAFEMWFIVGINEGAQGKIVTMKSTQCQLNLIPLTRPLNGFSGLKKDHFRQKICFIAQWAKNQDLHVASLQKALADKDLELKKNYVYFLKNLFKKNKYK
jgi:hypothetical protein